MNAPELLSYTILFLPFGTLILAVLCFLHWRKLSERFLRYKSYMDLSPSGIYFFEVNPPIPLSLSIEEQAKRFYKNARYQEVNEVTRKEIMKEYPCVKSPIGIGSFDFYTTSDDKRKGFFKHAASEEWNIKDLEFPWEYLGGGRSWRRFNAYSQIQGGCLVGQWSTMEDITDVDSIIPDIPSIAEIAVDLEKLSKEIKEEI